MGIIAGISPKKCFRKIHLRIPKKEKMVLVDEKIKGHHPMCENYSVHVLKLGKSYHCIGCIGMVTGAIISMIGSSLFFFLDYRLGNFDITVFFAGFLGVLYGLIIFNLDNVGKIVRFFSNAMYVVGAFLLLIGIDGMTSNFLLEIYLIIIIIFWIMTRITLSQYKHKKICAACQFGSCIFNEKKS
jgi:hypothetical protein